MKYTVEGVSYTSKAAATTAAKELHRTTGRAIQIVQGDSTYGEAQEVTWIGLAPLTAANEDLEPVDRTERLNKRFEPAPGTDLPLAE